MWRGRGQSIFSIPLVREATFGGKDGEYQESIRSAMLALSENFITADDDLETTLSRVTNAAVDLIDGIDYADVLLVLDGEFLSVAPADPSRVISMLCRCSSRKGVPAGSGR